MTSIFSHAQLADRHSGLTSFPNPIFKLGNNYGA